MRQVSVASAVVMFALIAILTGIVNASLEPWIEHLIAALIIGSGCLAIVSAAMYAGLCGAVEFIEYGTTLGEPMDDKDEEEGNGDSL
jgi:hypothetical protein